MKSSGRLTAQLDGFASIMDREGCREVRYAARKFQALRRSERTRRSPSHQDR